MSRPSMPAFSSADENTVIQQQTEDDDHIEVPISLAVDDSTRHWLYFRAVPRSEKEKSQSIHKEDYGGAYSGPILTKIHNGRTAANADELTLDNTSFELVQNCHTSLSTEDFYALQDNSNPKSPELKKTYYKEVEDFVKRTIGCDHATVFHHQVRSAKGGSGVQGYAGFSPHTDSSPLSGDHTAMLFQQSTSDKYKRYAYINLWRSISDDHPIQNDHLAVLDERSTVKPDDYIVKDLFGDGYDVVQYGLNARHAPQHKWYYFPGMTKDEALLFKQADSDWTKAGRTTFHMSVHEEENENEDKAEPKPIRESIEARIMCYWKETDSGMDTMPTAENTNQAMMKKPSEIAASMSSSSTSLASASTFDLLKALIMKPFGGISIIGDGSKSTYSGNPQDYVDKFTHAVETFPSWPSFAKDWVKMTIKGSSSEEEGIRSITIVIVKDQYGMQGTKNFTQEEKNAVVEELMNNGTFMKAAMKHFGPYAKADK